jgi:hypothetical protein
MWTAAVFARLSNHAKTWINAVLHQDPNSNLDSRLTKLVPTNMVDATTGCVRDTLVPTPIHPIIQNLDTKAHRSFHRRRRPYVRWPIKQNLDLHGHD